MAIFPIMDETQVSDTPIPGKLYRIKKGDTLLEVAGKAYGVKSGTKERLAFARRINRDSLNQKYIRKDKKTNLFPGGLISFYPHFSCDSKKLIKAKKNLPKGNCYAVIWIPPKKYNYHPILGQGKSILIDELEQELQEKEVEFQTNTSKPKSPYRSVKTQSSPYRWICNLITRFPDPDNNARLIEFDSGTGLLISKDHVLTAAHILYHQIEGSKGTPIWVKAKSVKIIPGRNGSVFSPFGIAKARESGIEFHSNYIYNGEIFVQYDYGLIEIENGNKKYQRNRNSLGFWGKDNQYRIKATTSEILDRKTIHTSGYPLYRLRHQRRTHGEVRNELIPISVAMGEVFDLIGHRAPTLPGQSGSPMWLESKDGDNKIRHLAAINQSGNYKNRELGQEPRFITLNKFISGIGIVTTVDMLEQIAAWAPETFKYVNGGLTVK